MKTIFRTTIVATLSLCAALIALALTGTGCGMENGASSPVAPAIVDEQPVTPLATTPCPARIPGSYTTRGGTSFPLGYCTEFAARRFDTVAPSPFMNWGGHASTWVTNAERAGWTVYRMSIDPTRASALLPSGTILCWGGGPFGHVAVVIAASSNGISIAEKNWGVMCNSTEGITLNFDKVTYTTLPWSSVYQRGSLQLAGFITPKRK